MICTSCREERDTERLPPGWHRDAADNPYCGACWSARYLLRAVTIPVAGPLDCTWQELRERLKICWTAATRLANWAVTELAKADIVRTPGMTRLPKAPQPYLYPEARQIAPEVDTGSLCAILHAVEGRWRKRRYEVVWLRKASLPSYRYPQPYPIKSDTWHAEYGEQKTPIVSVRLAGERLRLRLRGGVQFRRQLRAFDALVNGRAVRCEMQLYEQRTGAGGHRPGTNGRDAGRQRTTSRLMCKMVMWLPRQQPRELSGTLFLAPAADALVEALDVKRRRLWTIHAQQVARWQAEHRRRLEAWADDAKREERPVASFASRREAAVIKHRRRLDSAVKQYAAQIVAYARRARYGRIEWLDAPVQRYAEFPWAALRTRIKQLCDEWGIEYVEQSPQEVESGTESSCTRST